MTIAVSAIRDFLNKEREDWRWIKTLSEKDMLEELHDIAPKLRFKTKPRDYQLASLLLGIYNRQFLFLLDMGGGKSKIVLDTLNYHRLKGRIKRTLVVVPSPVNISDFAEQIETHSNIPYLELTGHKNERLNKLDGFEDGIAIINYAGLMAMTTDHVENRFMPIPSLVQEFARKFDSVVFDEIHMAKNRNTLTFKLCYMISRRYEFRYGLTGTPMGRDPMDLWAQFKIIDEGETLGHNITLYRNAFFKTKINYWGAYEFIFDKSKSELLNELIANKSIRYEASEMVSLPPVSKKMIHITLPWENGDYYRQAVQGMIQAKGNKTEIDNNFVRLRQISSGYFMYKMDEEKILVNFKENPKLESLVSLIESLPFDSKAVVVHEFIHSGRLIAKELKERKIKFVHLEGATKDKSEVRTKFKTDKSVKIFLMNWKSGSMGLNLQEANYMFFFESPVSPISRTQTERRVHRSGQNKHTFIYDFTCSKVEQKIQEYLREGKNLFEELINGRVSANSFLDTGKKKERKRR